MASFLNEHKDLPIVAHSAKYDRDEVLGPSYDQVGNRKNLPDAMRWRCTYELSYRLPEVGARNLDDILSKVGLERRRDGETHDAITDATLCGQAYMKLMRLPNPKKPHLGFYKK